MMGRRSLVLSLAVGLAAVPLRAAEPAVCGQAVQAALDRAGTNRAELVRALEGVSGPARRGMEFLIANMPDVDLVSLSAEFLVENTVYAYAVMEKVPWAASIPEPVFLNCILPYANVNERRERWRKEFHDRFLPLVAGCKTPCEAAARLNLSIFGELKVRYSTARPKADQSPSESVAAGLASCTGLSIILVDACRAVGIPARVAGTPMWFDRSGNHTWVEVWDGEWHFTGAAEPVGDAMDAGWFTAKAAQARTNETLLSIYAVSFERTPVLFPLAWEPSVTYVYATNVTTRYAAKTERGKSP